jgi:tetratricopeptide (TPR) repeat protein
VDGGLSADSNLPVEAGRLPVPSAPGLHRSIAEMSPPRAVAVRLTVAMLVATLGTGCRLVQRRGPVAPEVAEARRLCNEGLSAADRSDLVRAEGLLERAVKSCPGDIDARRHYADVLWKRGERMEAVAQINEALRLSPEDAALCVEGGEMYLEMGLFGDADRLAREAVRVAPGSADAWRLRGQVSLARGQAEPALADFHRALAIEPADRRVLLDTAEAYRRLDRPQRALATLAVLGETYGPSQTPANVLVLEGLAQEALGRPADAIDSYRTAVARGGAVDGAAERLAALERGSVAATAAQPQAPTRR